MYIKEQKEIAIYLAGMVIWIIGLSYLSVPLYKLYCQTTGVGGTAVASTNGIDLAQGAKNQVGTTTATAETAQRAKKALKVYLHAETKWPWTFEPTLGIIKVYPGDTALTFYLVENHTNKAQTGISTYTITPAKAGIYFNKIQCFCFEEQRLKAYERIELPILFFIDPEFENDPKMKDIEEITLSYTFLDSI